MANSALPSRTIRPAAASNAWRLISGSPVPREIKVDAQRFQFPAGESIRLFFSWRHTPALVRKLLGQHGLSVLDEWITKSGEEGVFLVSRARS